MERVLAVAIDDKKYFLKLFMTTRGTLSKADWMSHFFLANLFIDSQKKYFPDYAKRFPYAIKCITAALEKVSYVHKWHWCLN